MERRYLLHRKNKEKVRLIARLSKVWRASTVTCQLILCTALLSLNLPMNKESRKRKVAIVTPPDVRSLTNPRTPSPKRCREENGDNDETWNYESELGKLSL